VPVKIHCHRRGGMAQHSLDDLRVGAVSKISGRSPCGSVRSRSSSPGAAGGQSALGSYRIAVTVIRGELAVKGFPSIP
jgi:hypothetical protein